MNGGLVIGAQPQLELRPEFKMLAVEEPRCNLVPARDLLDETLIQLSSIIRFGCGYEPCSSQHGQVVAWSGWRPVLDEGCEVCCTRVIAEHIAQCLDEGCLAIASGTVEHEENMFQGLPCQ